VVANEGSAWSSGVLLLLLLIAAVMAEGWS
jgi:hypothetical protein